MCFRGFAAKDFIWCAYIFYARSRVKNVRTPNIISRGSDLLKRHMIFEISRSEISKIMCLSKDNLARSAMKRLFTQLHKVKKEHVNYE